MNQNSLKSSKRILSLFGFLFLAILIEWGGHRFTLSSVHDWYLTLEKPSWNPPAWIFGPVWTILYLSIAISGWLIFIKGKDGQEKRKAFLIYGLQLGSNFLWSYFFFYLKSPGMALLDISALVLLIALNIRLFAKLYLPAALLLVPYLIWTLFAAILNAAIWKGYSPS